MKIRISIITFLLILNIINICFTATFYVSTTGARTNGSSTVDDWSDANCYGTIGAALNAAAAAGDEIVVNDGTYYNLANFINDISYSIPDGASSVNPTIIRARNRLAVRIKNTTTLSSNNSLIYLSGSYVKVDGFVCEIENSNLPGPIVMIAGDHNRVTNCIAIRKGVMDNYGSWFNLGGSYNLIEDCAGTGHTRYGFYSGSASGATHHNIFRRCVGRVDYSDSNQPQATFCFYGNSGGGPPAAEYIAFQNCIAIDGNMCNPGTGTYGYTWAGFYFPHTIKDTILRGGIVLNVDSEYGGFAPKEEGGYNITMTNCISWANKNTRSGDGSARTLNLRGNAGGVVISSCTFGATYGALQNSSSNNGITYVNNSFINNTSIGNPGAYTAATYNGFNPSGQAFGSNPVTSSVSLSYLLRVEDGSGLDGAASDGGDVGATIIKKWGITGALWDETGWDTLTSDNLWPWPNENEIRAVFRETNNPNSGSSPSSNNTLRGFCVDGKQLNGIDDITLTSYIWEYLGNPIPSEIYGGGANNAPVLTTIGNKSVAENVALSFTITAMDADGDTLTYAATGLPSGASLSSATGAFSWMPDYTQAGNYSITFSVSDGNSGTDSEEIIVVVNNINQAPVLSTIGDKIINENSTLPFTANATDADGDTLTYAATGLPSGASLSSATGAFSWTPDYTQAGNYSITFSVSDGNSGTDSETIVITVTNVNQLPVLTSIGAKAVSENYNLIFTVSAVDLDGAVLSYSVTGLPAGASFDPATRVFSWTPQSGQMGSYNLTFEVSDGNGGTSSESITITVGNINQTPVLNQIGKKSMVEGSLLHFDISATDADGDVLSYTVTDLPEGASFVGANFSWTPTYEQSGSYYVTFSVSDGVSGTAAETITLTVTDADIVAPANVTDLTISKPSLNSVTLAWTAPGDDAQSGMAASYDVRYSTIEINESNWIMAIQLSEEITPQSAGAKETITIQGLPTNQIYHFALKVQDEAGNLSGLSNVVAILLKEDETKPVVIGVVLSDTEPVKAQDNFQLKIQFNESMNTVTEPEIVLDSSGEADPFVTKEGKWSNTVYPNDTYTTPDIVLNKNMSGIIVIKISGEKDLADNQMEANNIYSFTLDCTSPTAAIELSSQVIKNTGEYTVTMRVNETGSLEGVPKLRWLSAGGPEQEIELNGSNNFYQGKIWVESITSQGVAQFTWESVDAAGNEGSEITAGKNFEIDTTIYATEGGERSNRDGTMIKIPPGLLGEDVNVQIMTQVMNITSENNLDQAVQGVPGSVRDFILTSDRGGEIISELKGEITVEIPYADEDYDGLLDGTNIKEEHLRMFHYNQTTQKWELLIKSSVDSENNRVIGTGSHLSRVCLLSYAPPQWGDVRIYPNPCYAGQKVKISNLPLGPEITITIYDLSGDKVRVLREGEEIEIGPGSQTAVWDTKNEYGEEVASGVYLFLIKSNQESKSGRIAVIK